MIRLRKSVPCSNLKAIRETLIIKSTIIVKEIFDLYIGGMSIPKITMLLTDRKVPTPQLYNVQRGRKIYKLSEYMEIWSPQTIKDMLNRHAYAGRTINFTTTKKSFKNKNKYAYQKKIVWYLKICMKRLFNLKFSIWYKKCEKQNVLI